VLDLDDDLEGLDPFGIAPRAEPDQADQAATKTEDGGFELSSPLDAASAPAARRPAAPEKKKKKRRPARLRISYKKASTFLNEYKRNLKRGGTFIKTKKPLDVGRDCVLHLTIPGFDEPVELRGSVVWSSKGVEVMAGQEEGMGIKYDPADTAGVDSLKAAISSLESA
jgi:type IV pilus assembly protein PilZ